MFPKQIFGHDLDILKLVKQLSILILVRKSQVFELLKGSLPLLLIQNFPRLSLVRHQKTEMHWETKIGSNLTALVVLEPPNGYNPARLIRDSQIDVHFLDFSLLTAGDFLNRPCVWPIYTFDHSAYWSSGLSSVLDVKCFGDEG